MNAASILTPSANQVQPARAPAQGQRQAADGSEGDAATGFADLLVAIEGVAAQGDLVLAENLPQGAFQQGVPAPVMMIPSDPALAGALAAGAPAGQAPINAFSEIRPLIKPGPGENGVPTAGERPVLKRADAQRPLSPQQQAQQVLQNQQQQAGGLTVAMEAIEEAAQRLEQRFEMLKGGAGAEKADTMLAAATKTEAAAQAQNAAATSNPVVRQVAANLQFVARGEMERLRVDLHPEELGRVQIQLQKSGTTTRITVVAETAQAFEALKQGATSLQQSLSQAGFDTDDMIFRERESREDRFADAEDRRERNRRDADDNPEAERREVVVREALTSDRTVFL